MTNADYAADLVRAAPMDRHMGMISRLRDVIGPDPVIRGVTVGDEEVQVALFTKEGRAIGQLMVGVVCDSASRWRIAGIRLED